MTRPTIERRGDVTATATRPRRRHPPPARVRDRARRRERRLGLFLAAPAFVVMLLVTAYPLGYAVVLSLFNYRLTDPAGASSSA